MSDAFEAVDGKRYFQRGGVAALLLSGEAQYYRLDPSQWSHRLRRMRAALLSTVSTYVPWSIHERTEGEFDFSGRLDVRAYMRVAADLGMSGILKPSGYVCNELNGGGMPSWLWGRSPQFRTEHESYWSPLASWLDASTDELRHLQVGEQGNVVAWQVENEYNYGNEPYLSKQWNRVQAAGIHVPILINNNRAYPGRPGVLGSFDHYPGVSTEHLSNVGDFITGLRSGDPDSPLFASEFEASWLTTAFSEGSTAMGDLPADWLVSLSLLSHLWGVAGVNYYMFAAGTDPGMQSSRLMTGSYFGSAAITEWGGLTPTYLKYKSLHAQLLALSEVLTHPSAHTSALTTAHLPAGVLATQLESPVGDLLALTNATAHSTTFSSPWNSQEITLGPWASRLVVRDVALGSSTVVRSDATPVHFAGVLFLVAPTGTESTTVMRSDQGKEISMPVAHRAGAPEVVSREGVLVVGISSDDFDHVWFDRASRGALWFDGFAEFDDDGTGVVVELTSSSQSSAMYFDVDQQRERVIDLPQPSLPSSHSCGTQIEGWQSQTLGWQEPLGIDATAPALETNGLHGVALSRYRVTARSEGQLEVLVTEANDIFDLRIAGQNLGRFSKWGAVDTTTEVGDAEIEVTVLSTGLDKDTALQPNLSGLCGGIYEGRRLTIALAEWNRTQFLSSADRDRLFARADELRTFQDDGYARSLGIDVPASAVGHSDWPSREFSASEGGDIDASVEFSGLPELLEATTFTLESLDAGAHVLLKFDGVDLVYSVYVNGRHMASQWNGWKVWGVENSPRFVDISDAVVEGDNTVIVRSLAGPQGGGLLAAPEVSVWNRRLDRGLTVELLDDGFSTGDHILNSEPPGLRASQATFTQALDPNFSHGTTVLQIDDLNDWALIYVNGQLAAKHYPSPEQLSRGEWGGSHRAPYRRSYALWPSTLQSDNVITIVSSFAGGAGWSASWACSEHSTEVEIPLR